MTDRARDLAAAFDRAFAEPVKDDRAKGALALSIVAGGAVYLLPLASVSLVSKTPKLVPLPNGSPLQLGVAGLRGKLVTVFSLAALLGHPRDEAPAWVAVVRDVAIAFDAVQGHVELTGNPPNVLDVGALLERA